MGWFELLRDLGLFTIAAFMIEKWISNKSDKELEKYKSELDIAKEKHQLVIDSQLEVFKTKMEFMNFRHSASYEKQINAIIALYEKMVDVHHATHNLLSKSRMDGTNERDWDEKLVEKARKAFDEFWNQFHISRIYLSKKIDNTLNTIQSKYSGVQQDLILPWITTDHEEILKKMKSYSIESFNKEVIPLFNQLLEEMREIVGGNLEYDPNKM